jgi:single-strand DNA-binding protein
MRETYMHVAGLVATDPTVRKFDDGRQVMSFRVASTSRRYDNASKTWVDGQTLWVKVSCWRELAENAAASVRKGDRLVVWGRVRTEQWKGEDGGQRSDLAVEAEALGHDLAFGVATFERRRRTVSAQTLTAEGVVDMATGELTPVRPVELPPIQPGSAGTDVAASAPTSAGPGPEDDERIDELDDLDEEEDAKDGADREVSLLASA